MKDPWTLEHGGHRNNTMVSVEMAFRVARYYRDRIPHHTELMDKFEMSRATAFRWIRSMKNAREGVP